MKSLFYSARPILTDMLSTLAFAALFALTNNIYLATGVAIALGVSQVGYAKLRHGSVPGMQWASLGLVVVLGGATLMTGDPRFVMIKPTIIYITMGAAMLQKGWMARYVAPEGRGLVPHGQLVAWGYVWAGLMFATAAANLAIALLLGHKAWALFIGAFPLASKLALFAVNYASLRLAAQRVHRQRQALAAEPEAQAA